MKIFIDKSRWLRHRGPSTESGQKGVSLIITFFIMIIILAVVLSISALLYSEVKVIRNVGNSMISFYAADSGIEKVLFYDDQVLPAISTGQSCSTGTDCGPKQNCDAGVCKAAAKRGLCAIYPHDAVSTPNACRRSTDGILGNSSIFCDPNNDATGNFLTPKAGTSDPVAGCNFDVCDDCQVSFTTTLDNGATYYTTAKVFPSNETGTIQNSNFEITSKGSFGGAGRQIKISISAVQSQEVIQITSACANPKSTPKGQSIDISAYVKVALQGTDTIASVTASVYDALGNYYDANGNIVPAASPASKLPLSLVAGSGDYSAGTWKYTWFTTLSTPTSSFYVDLDVFDSLATPNEKKLQKILPCGF